MEAAREHPAAASPATLDEILRRRAAAAPCLGGFKFLADGDGPPVEVDLADLDRRARAVAAVLERRGVEDEPVLLLYPPGLDFVVGFFGCLYAGALAVPAYPPMPNRLERTVPRLEAMVRDAGARLALTTYDLLGMHDALAPTAPFLGALEWIATDRIPAIAGRDWRGVAADVDRVAFLQYTSGSTGSPRGVEVTHANLLANCSRIETSFGLHGGTRVVSWLPPYHDLGLIGGIVQPVYTGCTSTIMSPLAFLARPLRWLEAVTNAGATLSGGPNFAFDLCARRMTPEARRTLDLGSWDIAFSAGEPIQPQTLDRFLAAFGPCGLRPEALQPCYGLAEATLLATTKTRRTSVVRRRVDAAALEHDEVAPAADDSRARTLVASGRTLDGQRVVVVDPSTLRPCAPDRVGEIWIAGPSVARGYWRRPEETKSTFDAHLAESGEGPFLRTGDLGFVANGELFVTGRRKDVLIVRGRNLNAEDVEVAVTDAHPLLRPGCAAAFAVLGDGREQVVVVSETRPGEPAELEAAAARVATAIGVAHEIYPDTVVLIAAGTLPKTSSGKVQRSATRSAFVAGELGVLATWTRAGSR
jgi:acyl-CoA synthetase (AMP-forming)/AMP-acid ligase II